MSLESELEELMLKNSVEIDNFRRKIINGNKQLLEKFCNVILKLLKNCGNQGVAYRQTNQLLISAQPELINYIDQRILTTIANTHNRQDLDEYILFWKRLMPGTSIRDIFPNLNQRFKNLSLKHTNTELSPTLTNAENIFQNNFNSLEKKVQFFQDDSQVSDSIDQNQNSSLTIEFNMKQLDQIRQKLINISTDTPITNQYHQKIINFITLQPKYLTKQLTQKFNNQKLWAQSYLKNNKYKNYPYNKKQKQHIILQDIPTGDICLDIEQIPFQQQINKYTKSKRFQTKSQKQQQYLIPYRQTMPNMKKKTSTSQPPNIINTSNISSSSKKYINWSTMIKKNQDKYSLDTHTHQFKNTTLSQQSYKKLSEVSEERKKRIIRVVHEKLGEIENYIIQPYINNFNEQSQFNLFRRNCLSDSIVLYNTSLLLILCKIKRITDSKIKIQIQYLNKSFTQFAIQTLYSIPRCFLVQKQNQIKKNWILSQQQSHNFFLQLKSFPVQPCRLNLKYQIATNYHVVHQTEPIVIPIPITLKNFLQYLFLRKQEWIQKWSHWAEIGNYRIQKHIVFDKQVISGEELSYLLKDFTELNPIEGYSIKELGAYCRQSKFNLLTFLLRVSQRFDNIMTLQILMERKLTNKDQADFLDYCLNVWCMLLFKLDGNDSSLQNQGYK